jgi:hypothetical protein
VISFRPKGVAAGLAQMSGHVKEIRRVGRLAILVSYIQRH